MNANTTIDDISEKSRNGSYRLGNSVKESANKVKRTASSELSNLITDVEDLLKRVANVGDVDLEQLRERVEDKIEAAKETLAEGGMQVAKTARQVASATDDYVRKSPWQSVGIAVLTGAVIGYAVSALSSRR
ncbi:MAG TPA: DUF883 family protein [Steroidobacteraceae bacterium]|nr:DUF883 family protein [Steroidobacteraceae bacterium]